MARAHFVKSARKAQKENGIKKGDSYWWWKFRRGGKRVSLTQPKRSQLTQSDFYSQLWDLEDQVGALSAGSFGEVSDLGSEIESIKESLESLKDECEGKRSNMPEGLQDVGSGELLQSRVDELETLIEELDGMDFSEPDELDAAEMKEACGDSKSKEDVEAERIEEKCQELIDEAQGFNWGIG